MQTHQSILAARSGVKVRIDTQKDSEYEFEFDSRRDTETKSRVKYTKEERKIQVDYIDDEEEDGGRDSNFQVPEEEDFQFLDYVDQGRRATMHDRY